MEFFFYQDIYTEQIYLVCMFWPMAIDEHVFAIEWYICSIGYNRNPYYRADKTEYWLLLLMWARWQTSLLYEFRSVRDRRGYWPIKSSFAIEKMLATNILHDPLVEFTENKRRNTNTSKGTPRIRIEREREGDR